jgi:hypothetical protein
MYSATDVSSLHETGFPIQKSPDQSLFSNSPKLIAACHVFHRLLAPRHSPFALYSLATKQLTQSCWTLLCAYIQIVKERMGLSPRAQSSKLKAEGSQKLGTFSSELSTLSGRVVEVNGFEPMTSCVQGRRSPSWATPPKNWRFNIDYWKFSLFIKFNIRSSIVNHKSSDGGPGWSWTIDLTLIRRAL